MLYCYSRNVNSLAGPASRAERVKRNESSRAAAVFRGGLLRQLLVNARLTCILCGLVCGVDNTKPKNARSGLSTRECALSGTRCHYRRRMALPSSAPHMLRISCETYPADCPDRSDAIHGISSDTVAKVSRELHLSDQRERSADNTSISWWESERTGNTCLRNDWERRYFQGYFQKIACETSLLDGIFISVSLLINSKQRNLTNMGRTNQQ